MKSILLHVQDDDSLDFRIETALALARAAEGHVSCLHVTPIEAYVAFDSFGGVFVMQDVMKALDDNEQALGEKVKAKFANEDVSWDFEQVTGSVANTIISHAALSDIVVVGRQKHSSEIGGPTLSFLGDLLHRSRTPLLIPGSDERTYDPTGPVLVAWNNSYEAANSIRASLGLLRMASMVRVLRVE